MSFPIRPIPPQVFLFPYHDFTLNISTNYPSFFSKFQTKYSIQTSASKIDSRQLSKSQKVSTRAIRESTMPKSSLTAPSNLQILMQTQFRRSQISKNQRSRINYRPRIICLDSSTSKSQWKISRLTESTICI